MTCSFCLRLLFLSPNTLNCGWMCFLPLSRPDTLPAAVITKVLWGPRRTGLAVMSTVPCCSPEERNSPQTRWWGRRSQRSDSALLVSLALFPPNMLGENISWILRSNVIYYPILIRFYRFPGCGPPRGGLEAMTDALYIKLHWILLTVSASMFKML